MISIVIPSFNHGRALSGCLDSIVKQTDADWEIIVVDDGSTDDTQKVLHEFAARKEFSSRLHVIQQARQGAASARNAGLEQATGEYVLFADADLIMEPTMLADLREELVKNSQMSFAYSDFRFGWKLFQAKSFDPVALREQNYIHTSALIRRTDCPKFDERLRRFQDWDLWLTMVENGRRGVYVPKLLFTARIIGKGISQWRPRGWYSFFGRFPKFAPASYLDYVAAKQVVLEKHKKKLSERAVDVSVIIVTWNSELDIQPCLRSLTEQEKESGLSMETIVVDNGSSDQTISETQRTHPSAVVISNDINIGFARACNQGAALAHGRYLLFQNADSTFVKGAIRAMVSFIDNQPFIGVLGPQILRPDGSIQPSCRRFPGRSVLFALVAKLRYFVGSLRFMRAYEMSAFRHATMRSVDQVMGASFLVRRKVFDEVRGFDQRFYIWFEEADFCREVKSRGWLIFFYPGAQIIHGLSHSFAKRSLVWRQWNFTKSAARYVKKNYDILSALLIALTGTIVSIVLIPTAWLTITPSNRGEHTDPGVDRAAEGVNLFRWSWILFLSFVALDSLSFLGHSFPILEPYLFLGLVAVVVLISFRSKIFLFASVLAELILGSHGYAFLLSVGSLALGIRHALFLVAMAFFVGALSRFTWLEVIHLGKRFWTLWLMGLVGGVAVLSGYFHGNNLLAIYQDANGYVFLLLALPVALLARRMSLGRIFLRTLFLCGVYLAFRTLFVFYVFTHDLGSVLDVLYDWLRDTRLAEITATTTGAYRIFFPSQIWLIGLWVLLLIGLEDRSTRKQSFAVSIVAAASLLASFSRSFWLGWVAATSMFCIWYLYKKQSIRSTSKLALLSLGSVGLGLLLLVAILRFPIPKPASDGSLDFRSRFNVSESAAVSRWNLLKPINQKILEAPFFGSGFGTPVTYQSSDPRVIAETGDGTYTTTIFEWGYLDMLTEFGFVGLAMLLLVIGVTMWRIWESEIDPMSRGVWLLFLFSILIVHAASPYLNHPLGAGFLAFLIGISIDRRPVSR